MHNQRSCEKKKTSLWRLWPVPVLAGVTLVMAVLVVSASTAAPQANNLYREQLSSPTVFAAYPELAIGDGGLVAAAWTEGAGGDTDAKHVGPLKLSWVSDSTEGWQTLTIDTGEVYDVAIAVSGSTVHLVWSLNKVSVRHKSCTLPDCSTTQVVATANKEALQVDLVLDSGGMPHVVWIEEDNKVHYGYKSGGSWFEELIPNSSDSDFPAMAFALDQVHVAWAEWKDGPTSRYSVINHCNRPAGGGIWTCVTPLAEWVEHSARNPSVAADENNNVYVVWDYLDDSSGLPDSSKIHYTIGYNHFDGVGWQGKKTYPAGSEFGTSARIFESGEGQVREEYVRFLRPQVSLALSGTETVPVLVWHGRVSSGDNGGGEEELAAATAGPAYKVFWDYATRSGSDSEGHIYWAGEPYTLSMDLCGQMDLNVDSATANLAVVGDLNDVNEGGTPGGEAYVHTVYHEETGNGAWGIFYNNNVSVACLRTYLPIVAQNASGGAEGP